MRKINYATISSKIRIYVGQHPTNVTFASFVEAMKPCLNRQEAIRLLDYYIGENKLKSITKRRFAFTIPQSFFTDDAVRDVFLKNDIQSRFGKNPSNKTVLKNLGVEQPKVIEPEVIELYEPSVTSVAIDYSELSDEDISAMIVALQNEQTRRQAIARRKAQLEEILDVAGVTREELQELLAL